MFDRARYDNQLSRMNGQTYLAAGFNSVDKDQAARQRTRTRDVVGDARCSGRQVPEDLPDRRSAPHGRRHPDRAALISRRCAGMAIGSQRPGHDPAARAYFNRFAGQIALDGIDIDNPVHWSRAVPANRPRYRGSWGRSSARSRFFRYAMSGFLRAHTDRLNQDRRLPGASHGSSPARRWTNILKASTRPALIMRLVARPR